MQTKEEYYQYCLKHRELVKNTEITKCTCPKKMCDWYGKCKECVALHRYYNDHLPACLHPLIKSKKFEDLIGLIEKDSVERESRPIEYYQYVREKDNENNIGE